MTDINILEFKIDDSLNVILSKALKVKGKRVALVFPEGIDVLNSAIGLETLHEKLLKKGKEVLIVVPNSSYINFVKSTGFVVTTKDHIYDDNLWQLTQLQVKDYVAKHYSKNSSSYKDDKMAENSTNKDKHVIDKSINKTVNTSDTIPSKIKEPEIVSSSKLENIAFSKVKPKLAFKKVVQNPNENSKSKITKGVHKDSVVRPLLQQDSGNKKQIKKTTNKSGQVQQLIGMDFGHMVKPKKRSIWSTLFAKSKLKSKSKVKTQVDDSLHLRKPIVQSTPHIQEIKKRKGFGFIKILAFLFLILIVFGGLLFYIYYLYMPRIRVEVQVKSTKVPIKGKIVGTESSSTYNVEKKEIRIVKEVVQKEGSVNVSATQKVTSGEYAKGVIRVLNTANEDIKLPAGTIFETDGLKYKSVGEVTVPALSSVDVTVQATNYGEEYNISAGKNFTISGVDNASALTAQNLSAFTGGSKRVYTVLGKKDVEDAVDSLKKSLYAQAVSDLENMRQDEGFVFIKNSVKNELDGDYQLDKAIGTEMSEDEEAYLVVKTKSEGIYYSKPDLERLVETLLIQEYRKMLNIPDNIELMVKDVNIDITKTSISNDRKRVTIEFEATGLITPKLTEDDVIKLIKGVDWVELPERLSTIKGLASPPKIIFIPDWMPEFLRYVPQQDSRIDVSIRTVEDTKQGD